VTILMLEVSVSCRLSSLVGNLLVLQLSVPLEELLKVSITTDCSLF
jgi:hypothetical protein